MMLFCKRLLVPFVVLLITGCASKNVDWDYNPEQSLTGLNAYFWLEQDIGVAESGYKTDTLQQQRVQNSFDNIMRARGYRRVDDEGAADFLVNYSVSEKSRLDSHRVSTSFGYGTRAYDVGFHNNHFVQEYDEATLTIDFIDPESRQVLWRGRSRTRVQEKLTPQRRTERVNQEVMDILSGFPQP